MLRGPEGIGGSLGEAVLAQRRWCWSIILKDEQVARGRGSSVKSKDQESGAGPAGSKATGTLVCLDCKCLVGTGDKRGGRDQVQGIQWSADFFLSLQLY